MSDIRPYTFVLGLNETEGTISINGKSPCTLLRLRLSSYNLIRNATANTEWFSDNNPIGLSILTTILANTLIVGYLTIEEKQTSIQNNQIITGPLDHYSLIKSPFPFPYQYLLNKYFQLSSRSLTFFGKHFYISPSFIFYT